VAAEAGKHITLEGQEKDVTTAGLARMNMILHDFPTANILSGNTLAARSSRTASSCAPTTTWSPIRRSPTRPGAPA
jgi:type I restriction-modification system DNA methylase subunit